MNINTPALLLIVFGVTNIMFPDIIAYLIGWVCVFLWVTMLLGGSKFWPKKANGENYVKVWDYKIFR